MELWNCDAIRMKINIIKSFMKAGVFLYNSKSIDRTGILKSNISIDTFSLNFITYLDKTSNNNQINNSSSSNNSQMLNANSHLINNHPSIINTVSSQPIAAPFTSSEAFAALDQILQETISITRSESNDDVEGNEDEEYFPFNSTATSSTATSSTNQKIPQRNKSSTIKHHQPIPSRQNKKRKKKSSNIVGFVSSDDDGNIFN